MSTTAIETSQFLGALGVNVHVEYTDGKYANTTNVLNDLRYLGLNQVRDANLNPANQGQANYGILANAGIKFDLIVGGSRTIAQSMASLDAFVQAHPGAVSAVEGPNEVNNWPFTYNGLTGAAAYTAFQSALYAAVHADSNVSKTPVYSLTGSTAVVTGFDYTNMHDYPRNGSQPWATLSSDWAAKSATTGHVPLVITESGFSTLPSSVYGVDQATQAKETLNLLFDATKLGASKVYLYELLDAYPDTTGTNSSKHYGLFNLDNTPKLAATAIHDLTTILADTGATASTFQPGSLNYSVTNLPATGSSMLLEKSNGAFDLVVWAEPTIWDSVNHVAIAAPTVQTTVALGAVFAEVRVYDPLSGTDPISILHNVSQVTVGLTDHPLIIEVEPGAGVAATSPSKATGAVSHSVGVMAASDLGSSSAVKTAASLYASYGVSGAAGSAASLHDLGLAGDHGPANGMSGLSSLSAGHTSLLDYGLDATASLASLSAVHLHPGLDFVL